jgi:hypothetical protein
VVSGAAVFGGISVSWAMPARLQAVIAVAAMRVAAHVFVGDAQRRAEEYGTAILPMVMSFPVRTPLGFPLRDSGLALGLAGEGSPVWFGIKIRVSSVVTATRRGRRSNVMDSSIHVVSQRADRTS